MTTPALAPAGPREWFRRHERPVAAAWLLLVALVVAVLAVPSLRDRALLRLQRGADAVDRRWDARLAEGEALVRAGRWAEAAAYLERLDREFPAPNVRAGRDRQRERLLALLAQAYEGAGRKGRAIETWTRRAEFDPRAYRNLYDLGAAHARLAGGWAMPMEARDAWLRVLAIQPSHVPSVRGVMDYYVDRGDWVPAVATWETFLNAFLVQAVEVGLGDSTRAVNVLVDGEFHDVVVPFARPAGWRGTLRLGTDGFPLEVERVTLVAPLLVGAAGGADSLSFGPDAGWVPQGMTAVAPGRFRPDSAVGGVRLEVPALPRGVASLHLRLRLAKPVDGDLWAMARKSYNNLLNQAGRAASERRLILLESAALADQVGPRTE